MNEAQTLKFWNDPKFLIVMCLTLGLAPFIPEPHIWGKVRWIMGGGHGMKAMDYFDFLMHGTPWFLLIRYAVIFFISKIKTGKEIGNKSV
ncbi:MAG: hypothetical protein U0V54_06930 [Saprospiraceae bacterium]